MVLNSNQDHASTPRFEDGIIEVLAPAGTVLVDTLTDGKETYSVNDDNTVDITVPPMSGVLLVPDAEFVLDPS